MICPSCKADLGDNPIVDGEGLVDCHSCGIWFDPEHTSVQRDTWLIENNLEPVLDAEAIYEKITERDALRDICVQRQENVCVVCGHGMYGDAQVHEAIIKRSDLPGDTRVFSPINCVALHAKCHENTKNVDDVCMLYLIGHYGITLVMGFILSLNMKKLPGRAQAILNIEWSRGDRMRLYGEYIEEQKRLEETNG